MLPGAICTAHALAGHQSHPELCFCGTHSTGRTKIDTERRADEKPHPEGEGMCQSSAPEPQGTLCEKHWITGIGSTALDFRLAPNHPSCGDMDLFPIPHSPFPISYSLYPLGMGPDEPQLPGDGTSCFEALPSSWEDIVAAWEGTVSLKGSKLGVPQGTNVGEDAFPPSTSQVCEGFLRGWAGGGTHAGSPVWRQLSTCPCSWMRELCLGWDSGWSW